MANLQRINKEVMNLVGYANRRDMTNMSDRYITAGSQNVDIENIDEQTTRIMTSKGVTPCNTITFNADVRYAGSYNCSINGVERFYVAYVDKTNVSNTVYLYESQNDVCNPVSVGAFGSQLQYVTDKVRFTRFKEFTSQKQTLLFANNTNRINFYDGTDSGTVLNPMRFGNGTGNQVNGAPKGQSVLPPKEDYTIDYIKSYKNQIYIGSKTSPYIYISNSNDYTNFTYDVLDRVMGDAATLTLDANCRGFSDDETSMKIFADNNYVYETVFTDFANSRQSVTLKALKVSNGQGAIEQELITNIKNGVMYISKERTVDILSSVQQFSSTQSTPINDIVQVDFDNFNYKDANMFYHKRHVYFMFPNDSTIMRYSLEKGNWQAPRVMGVNIAGLIAKDDILYGYEYITDDNNGIKTYRMDCFNSYNKESVDYSLNDDGIAIESRIVFPYTHLGYRHHQKHSNNIFLEGYISANSKIDVTCLYEYGGANNITEKTIYGSKQKGDERNILYEPKDTVSLGKLYLGSNSMSNNKAFVTPKFRSVMLNKQTNFYEYQIQLYGNEYDQHWGILSLSTNAGLAFDTNFAITK